MASSNNNEIISHASPHTIKKFDLIEKYVESWAQKLCNNPYCDYLVFIDCMSNSGMYVDDDGNPVTGTPVRVAKYLRDVAGRYPRKDIFFYANDKEQGKIEELKKHIPMEPKRNFHVKLSSMDANDLLRKIGKNLNAKKNMHYLLVYDPYVASIDWDALMPFLNNWGEVILNHMVSDSVRAVKQAKSTEAIEKYEQTYRASIDELVAFNNDRKAFENRIQNIIKELHVSGRKAYYVASFPFFNRNNALVYDLIHCTSNDVGFNLFKTTAWQTFNNKSSDKKTYGNENQLAIDFTGSGRIATVADEYCYHIKDISEYIASMFAGRSDVDIKEIWDALRKHPVFPVENYKRKILSDLLQQSGVTANKGKNKISFTGRSY